MENSLKSLTAALPQSRSIRAFAQAHGLSVPTVYRMIQRRELVALKAGPRRTIITTAAELHWLASLPRVAGEA